MKKLLKNHGKMNQMKKPMRKKKYIQRPGQNNENEI